MVDKILLSPSSIGEYLGCPYKYYLDKILKVTPLQPMFKEALDFGHLVHEAIKHYYEIIPIDITPKMVKLYISKAIKDVGGVITDRLEIQLRGFAKFERERLTWGLNPKPVAVEQMFEKPPLHGVVDALFRKGRDYVVVDWKTGYRAVIDEGYALQGMAYKYLTDAKEMYFVFLQYGQVLKLPNYSFDWFWNKVQSVINGIKNKRFNRLRGEQCKYCEFQIYCKLAEEGITIWQI